MAISYSEWNHDSSPHIPYQMLCSCLFICVCCVNIQWILLDLCMDRVWNTHHTLFYISIFQAPKHTHTHRCLGVPWGNQVQDWNANINWWIADERMSRGISMTITPNLTDRLHGTAPFTNRRPSTNSSKMNFEKRKKTSMQLEEKNRRVV